MRIANRAPLAGILVAILLASCGGRPELTTSVNSEPVQMTRSSTTDRMGCSGVHGDAFPRDVPVTSVSGPGPATLRFDAGGTATRIRAWIYDVDAPMPDGGPMQELTIRGGSGTHELGMLSQGRTYQFLVNVEWSALISSGEVSHVFRLRLAPQ